ncbi:putative metal-dependent hydrolase YcfH [Abditibacteriota bacterium]|nr:putative metal-dependent hydrolase YcfH [Abditibacteriota bacterium]
MFFDSHCHLSDERLFAELAAVVERADAAQVGRVLSIAVDLADASAIAGFANGARVWASAGVHPASALTWKDEDSNRELRALLDNPLCVAVGECGLDYVYDDTHPHYPGATRPRQVEVFEQQLEIAAQTGKAVVIHNRDADGDILSILERWRSRLRGGVFHCFSSDWAVARRILDLDFHLGFTGIVTFKNAPLLHEVAQKCPLERMLIETDAPYLAPVPHRGKQNEPSFVPYVAGKIAELKGLSREEVGEITTANANALFGI